MATAPNAAAGVDAGAASAVIGAGASSIPSGGGAGDSGVDTGALLSDDQILGITPETGTPEPQVETIQPVTQAAPGTEPQLAIDDFKALFGANPKVQSLWDKYDNSNKLITQFGTVADARKAAETVQMLGGVEHLTSLATKAASVDQTDAVFFGGKPEDRKTLANEWYDGEGPQEFAVTSQAISDQIDATLGVMQARDPQRYLSHMDRITREALGAEKFDGFLAQLATALQSGQGLDKAAQQLLEWGHRLGLDKGKGQPSPDAERLTQRERELNQRDQSWQQKQETAAIEAADTEIGTNVKSEITKTLGELKINGRPLFGANSNKVRETIEGQIRSTLDAQLAKNPVLIAQCNSLRAKGLQGRQKELVELTMRHAKLALPGVVEQVVGEWTKSVVSTANGTAARAAAGASRVDVGSGAASGGRTKGNLPTIRDVNEKKMTPDQILDL